MKLGVTLSLIVLISLIYSGTFNPGDSEGTLGTGDMDTASSLDHCVDVSRLAYIGLQFQHGVVSGAGATLAINGSVRADASAAEDYDTYPSSSQTITGTAAASYWWDIDTRSLGNVCVVYSKGTMASGTYTIYYRKEVPTK